MRDEIIEEIRRLAIANGGQPPGQIVFARETGIGDHHWLGKLWARWSDALTEAGYEPNKRTERLDSDRILLQIAAACRHYGRMPTKAELQLFRSVERTLPSAHAITRHFGGKGDVVVALLKLATADPAFADLAPMLATEARAEPRRKAMPTVEGSVYLIKSGEFYKIGRGDDLERRVKEIRIALPDKATLVHTIRTDDPAGIEAYWHRRFADRRANGEWFKLTSSDVSAFRKRRFQ